MGAAVDDIRTIRPLSKQVAVVCTHTGDVSRAAQLYQNEKPNDFCQQEGEQTLIILWRNLEWFECILQRKEIAYSLAYVFTPHELLQKGKDPGSRGAFLGFFR